MDVISIFDRLVSKVVRTARTLYATSANHMVKPRDCGRSHWILEQNILPILPDDQGRVQRPSRRRSVIKAQLVDQRLTVLGISVLQFVVLIPSVPVASRTVNSMKRTRSTKRRRQALEAEVLVFLKLESIP